jgi:hypothetical protein
MDKSKHKRGDQSLIGQLFVKRLSFCSSLTLEECSSRLISCSGSKGRGFWVLRPSVFITVESLDPDHCQFKITEIYNARTRAYISGTLTRMGYETLVTANGFIIWGIVLFALLTTISSVGLLLSILIWSPSGLSLCLMVSPCSLLYMLMGFHVFISYKCDRDRLCERLVYILVSQDKS